MAAPCLVMLDCDGTLVDAQAAIIQALTESFRRAGLPIPDPLLIRHCIGLSLDRVIQVLAPQADSGAIQRLAAQYRGLIREMRHQPAVPEPLYPGAIAALDQLRAAGAVLGIATGKGRRGLLATLEHFGIADRFVTLQTPDNAPGKPAPGMLLQAMAETGFGPDQTMMVGDTSFDIMMARAAGAVPIGVSWGYHPAAELEAEGARQILDRFDQLPVVVAEVFS